MKPEFVVVDGNGNTSFDSKKEESEKFSTYKSAKRRADELAKSEPGKPVSICEVIAKIECVVSKPTTVASKGE